METREKIPTLNIKTNEIVDLLKGIEINTALRSLKQAKSVIMHTSTV